MDPITTNLYRALVEALQARGTATPDQPVTVAEIYQELIPYRGVRETLGFELNADYEHALLRLLAGESGLLRLEPSSARDELRQELESPNPYVGLYRKFAACDVWVSFESSAQSAVSHGEPGGHIAPAPEATEATLSVPAPKAVPVPESVPAPTATPLSHSEPVSVPVPTAADQATDEAEESAPASCPFCHEIMPVGRVARYCPQCGGDQRSRPCERCGEVLDYAWRYCISCGAAAATSSPTRVTAG